ncbi:hypothetical protein APHAL10511_002527 [Amanita phalloides]|nr:hypothetical protein APHAL10511_002527 [Amanita phalloides]
MPEPSHRYRAAPSAPSPGEASPKPQRRPRYREKAKSPSETSIVLDSVHHLQVDPHITTLPSLNAPEAEGPSVPDESKLSPIIDLINRRLKTISRKIAHIEVYASTDPQHVNADQKRFMRTLPTQLAIHKELSEVKRVVEAQEAYSTHEPVAGTREAEEAEGADTGAAQVDAVPPQLYSQLQETFVAKTIDLLNLLRYSLLASGKLDTLSTDKTEGSIIDGVADALLGMDDDKRRASVEGFLHESGDFDGLSYTLLVEIAKAGLALHRAPTPLPAEETQGEEPAAEPETAAAVVVAGIPEGLPQTKKINFVQESEIGNFGTSGGGSAAAPERETRGRVREGAEREEAKLVERRRVAPVREGAGEGRKKREEQRHKREEGGKRRPEKVGQVKAEAERKDERGKRDKEQKWIEEWQQVEQLNRNRAEKVESLRLARGSETRGPEGHEDSGLAKAATQPVRKYQQNGGSQRRGLAGYEEPDHSGEVIVPRALRADA